MSVTNKETIVQWWRGVLLFLTVAGIAAMGATYKQSNETANEVTNIKAALTRLDATMETVKAASNTTASAVIGINYTVSEGLKSGMAEQGRRIANLEQRVDKQAEEIARLQIELAKTNAASGVGTRR